MPDDNNIKPSIGKITDISELAKLDKDGKLIESQIGVKTTWYGGRRYYLKDSPASISQEDGSQKSDRQKKVSKTYSLTEIISLVASNKLETANKDHLAKALWSLHEEGKIKLKERNVVTQALSNIVKDSDYNHAVNILNSLFSKDNKTSINDLEKLPEPMLENLAESSNNAKKVLSNLRKERNENYDRTLGLINHPGNLIFPKVFEKITWIAPGEEVPLNKENCIYSNSAKDSPLFKEAVDWLKSWEQNELGEFFPNSVEDSILTQLQKSADAGKLEALILLGNYHKNRSDTINNLMKYNMTDNIGLDQDKIPDDGGKEEYHKALKFYQQAAKQTNDPKIASEATSLLVEMYQKRSSFLNNQLQKEGVEFIESLTKNPYKNKQAAEFLAKIHKEGLLNQPIDEKKAAGWEKIAKKLKFV